MDKKKTNIFFPIFWSAMTAIRVVAYCLEFKYEDGFSWSFILESLLVVAFFAVAIGYWVRYIKDKKGEKRKIGEIEILLGEKSKGASR